MDDHFEIRSSRAAQHLEQIKTDQPRAEGMWRQRSNRLLVELFENLVKEMGVVTLLECGAHEAEISKRFARSGMGRRAFAIEANPFTFESMTVRAAEHGVIAICEGLGAKSGTATLWIPAPDATHTRPRAPHASFLRMAHGEGQHHVSVEVPVTTLDLLADRHHVEGDVALWMDVEGVALDVIRGGPRLFSEQAAIVFLEVESQPFWEGQPLVGEVEAQLLAYGLIPIARDFERSYQYNAIYARGLTPAMEREIEAFQTALLRPIPPAVVTARYLRRRIWKRLKRAVRTVASWVRAAAIAIFGVERLRRARRLLRGG